MHLGAVGVHCASSQQSPLTQVAVVPVSQQKRPTP